MNQLKRYDARHVWLDGQRCYSVDGQTLPGITTVLDATKSKADKAGLQRWRERVGDAEADRIRDEALARGTAVHAAIEATLTGADVPTLTEEHVKFRAISRSRSLHRPATMRGLLYETQSLPRY